MVFNNVLVFNPGVSSSWNFYYQNRITKGDYNTIIHLSPSYMILMKSNFAFHQYQYYIWTKLLSFMCTTEGIQIFIF
jgi:hypothetical protein